MGWNNLNSQAKFKFLSVGSLIVGIAVAIALYPGQARIVISYIIATIGIALAVWGLILWIGSPASWNYKRGVPRITADDIAASNSGPVLIIVGGLVYCLAEWINPYEALVVMQMIVDWKYITATVLIVGLIVGLLAGFYCLPTRWKNWEIKVKTRKLLGAAHAGNSEKIKKLLQKGIDVNLEDKITGQTALMYAAMYGHSDVVKMLLENGAKINASDKNTTTALWYAARYLRYNVVKILLDNGANPTTPPYPRDAALINKQALEADLRSRHLAPQEWNDLKLYAKRIGHPFSIMMDIADLLHQAMQKAH